MHAVSIGCEWAANGRVGTLAAGTQRHRERKRGGRKEEVDRECSSPRRGLCGGGAAPSRDFSPGSLRRCGPHPLVALATPSPHPRSGGSAAIASSTCTLAGRYCPRNTRPFSLLFPLGVSMSPVPSPFVSRHSPCLCVSAATPVLSTGLLAYSAHSPYSIRCGTNWLRLSVIRVSDSRMPIPAASPSITHAPSTG